MLEKEQYILLIIQKKKKETVIIIELKWNGLAKTAIKHIHDKKYYDNLNEGYKGNILLIGIG